MSRHGSECVCTTSCSKYVVITRARLDVHPIARFTRDMGRVLLLLASGISRGQLPHWDTCHGTDAHCSSVERLVDVGQRGRVLCQPPWRTDGALNSTPASVRVGPGERSLHKCIWKLRSHLVLNVQGYHRVDLHLIWQSFIKCGQILYYATHCHADSERGNACDPVNEMRERAVRI